jgi:hypothetical protein
LLLAIVPHVDMGLYKISSRFTTWVQGNTKNPDEVLSDLDTLINEMDRQNKPMSFRPWELIKFHTRPEQTDEEVRRESVTPKEGDKKLRLMYGFLSSLEPDFLKRMGIGRNTIAAIRKWQEAEGQPTPAQVAGPVRRTGPRKQQEVPELTPVESPPKPWERGEERAIRDIDRATEKEWLGKKSALLPALMVIGIVEETPTQQRRRKMFLRQAAFRQLIRSFRS